MKTQRLKHCVVINTVVMVMLPLYLLIGLYEMAAALISDKRRCHDLHEGHITASRAQIITWITLLAAAGLTWFMVHPLVGLVFLLAAQLWPRPKRCKQTPSQQMDLAVAQK